MNDLTVAGEHIACIIPCTPEFAQYAAEHEEHLTGLIYESFAETYQKNLDIFTDKAVQDIIFGTGDFEPIGLVRCNDE